MEIGDLKGLRGSLTRFVRKFDGCIKTKPSRRHLKTYLAGQLGPLERKSVEPIALEARVPPRTLQEFLSIHRWDEEAVGRRLRELVVRHHGDANGIGVIDETSFPKKGKKTPGVQRQYCGARGKTENCVVTVHLGYAAGEDFHTLLDGDLFLPEKTWANNRPRCREAGIPDDVVYRPKWRIALDLIERSLGEGVPMRWITADEAYGRVRTFRETVGSLGLTYVVEIPANLTGWTRKPAIEAAGAVSAHGQKLKKPRVRAGEKPARAVANLWKHGGPAWTKHLIKTTEKGPVVWEVRETRFFANNDGVPGAEERLLILREVLTGEVKYFLCPASPEIPLKILLFVAFSRWRVELTFPGIDPEFRWVS